MSLEDDTKNCCEMIALIHKQYAEALAPYYKLLAEIHKNQYPVTITIKEGEGKFNGIMTVKRLEMLPDIDEEG